MDSGSTTLEVDLGAILRNWKLLNQTHGNHDCAAVVKANAYGLGMEEIAATLADAGCPHFFVATLDEAIELREVLTSQFIYVLAGVQGGEVEGFLDYNIIPVLNSMPQFERWEAVAKDTKAAASVLHIDTGMNRLGISVDEAEKLAMEEERLHAAQIRFIMSHLACASHTDSEFNKQQLERFSHIRRCFPNLPASLSNSAGVFLGSNFHHDLARPGCALYGINPFTDRPNPVEPVVTLTAPILQLRTTTAESEPVGYGGDATVPKGTRVATVGIGYGDGLHRILSGSNLHGYIGEHAAPIIGRISMDLITLDVTHIPRDALSEGTSVELLNAKQDVNAMADAAQTIGYEILTSISPRVKRHYHGYGQSN
ncbi:MAG: alanine racemase [Rickettsiales bacterium]|nr:alanine racemase [Rickettsiales bacterium]